MIVHPRYGPQFDPLDGTIGTIRLVKRWVIVNADDLPLAPRQGRYTYETQADADARAVALILHNPNGTFKGGLRTEQWWCFPEHFDPFQPVRGEAT